MSVAEELCRPFSVKSREPLEMNNSECPPRSAGVNHGTPWPGSAKFTASLAEGVPPPIIAPTESNLTHCQDCGISNRTVIASRRPSSRGFLISPASTNRAFSTAIRFNNSDAGSSSGSCGTSFPRTAKSRINRRRRGTASGPSAMRSEVRKQVYGVHPCVKLEPMLGVGDQLNRGRHVLRSRWQCLRSHSPSRRKLKESTATTIKPEDRVRHNR